MNEMKSSLKKLSNEKAGAVVAWALFLSFTILPVAGCSSGSSSDTEAASKRLEDRLTESLEFEGGEVQNGQPPAGDADPENPQIENVVAPEEFRLGAYFSVILTTEYDKFQEVQSAIVHVKKANKYIIIEKSLVVSGKGYRMELKGKLIDDKDLGGSFTLEYALQTGDGRTGEYVSSTMEVPEDPPECEPGPCCNGGAWIGEGEPCVSGVDDLECTDDLCSSGHACEPHRQDGFCLIGGVCHTDGEVNQELGCQKCDSSSDPVGWSIRSAGEECRPVAGMCDIAETCDGTDSDCPVDAYLDEGEVCDDGNYCTANDACDGLGPDIANCIGELYSCNNHGNCNQADAFCTCDTGYKGIYCDQCERGYSGYPDCAPIPESVAITPVGFIMGSPDGISCPPDDIECGEPPAEELGRQDDERQHQVSFSYSFELMTTEVTQSEFENLLGYNPSNFNACEGDCPIENVSWHEALAFANAKSLVETLSECFDCIGASPDFECSLKSDYEKPQDCLGYRLPTEAEWEYSIRAGSRTPLYPADGNNGQITETDCSLDPNLNLIGWYCGNENAATREYGEKLPNAFGLYDMSGNVWEWVWDKYCPNYETYEATDPFAASCSGLTRVNRGGAWNRYAQFCRSAARHYDAPTFRNPDLGFRLARTVE